MLSHNRLYAPLFTADTVNERFSTERTLADFLAFEGALLAAQAQSGRVPAQIAQAGAAALSTFEATLEKFDDAVMQDGLPVPEFVRQLKAHVGPEIAPFIHLDTTSQDLIDTSLTLAIRDMNDGLVEQIGAVSARLDALGDRFGRNPLMARTRMQSALPATVDDRLRAWTGAFDDAQAALQRVRPQIEVLQLGGPVGTYQNAPDADAHVHHMCQILGLTAAPSVWHSTRGRVADYANVLSLITGALGKIGTDIALMSQQGVGTISLAGGGRSSAMPHKQNPVLAETLITFARYNAGQLGLIHQALIHEQERSGAAWVLEWMTLPAMIATTVRALDLANVLFGKVDAMGDPDPQ